MKRGSDPKTRMITRCHKTAAPRATIAATRTSGRARVPLARALSKLGILSRAQALDAIRAGRVSVDGRIVRTPATSVVPERARIAIDDRVQTRTAFRAVLFH